MEIGKKSRISINSRGPAKFEATEALVPMYSREDVWKFTIVMKIHFMQMSMRKSVRMQTACRLCSEGEEKEEQEKIPRQLGEATLVLASICMQGRIMQTYRSNVGTYRGRLRN